MLRRLLIATIVGILAAFAVAGFRHAMLLYWSGCSSIMTLAVWSMQRQIFPRGDGC